MNPIYCVSCKHEMKQEVMSDCQYVFCNHCTEPVCENCWGKHRELHRSPIKSVGGTVIYKPRARFTKPTPATKPAVQTEFNFPK